MILAGPFALAGLFGFVGAVREARFAFFRLAFGMRVVVVGFLVPAVISSHLRSSLAEFLAGYVPYRMRMATVIEERLTIVEQSPWRQRWVEILAGFGVAFLVGYVSAKLTASAGNWNTGLPWERSMMMWIHGSIPPAIDPFMLIFPWFGTNISLIPGIALLVWWLWKREHVPNEAMRLAVVQLGSYLLNPSLKAMFDRARPDLFERRGWYGWSSYPSGHAIASISVLITLAIILHRVKGWTWPYYVFIPIMLASLYSRIYLGVHWPTDVFAGMVVGAAWLLVTMWAFRDREPAGS